MKKILIVLLISSMILITACSPDEALNDTNSPNDSSSKTPADTPGDADNNDNQINMQNYTLTVPDNYELLQGGHDGVIYKNAILKPKDSAAYEIELDFGVFFINSAQERKNMIAYEFGATALDISTEEYIQEGFAHTYTFEHDKRGLVQAIELITGTDPIYYMRGFIDILDNQGLNDPTKVLSDFMAKNITMVEIKAD